MYNKPNGKGKPYSNIITMTHDIRNRDCTEEKFRT